METFAKTPFRFVLLDGRIVCANVRWVDDYVVLIAHEQLELIDYLADVSVTAFEDTGQPHELEYSEPCAFDDRRRMPRTYAVPRALLDSLADAKSMHVLVTYQKGNTVWKAAGTVPRQTEAGQPTCRLAVMTLLLDDHALLPLWLAHNRRLGVERFVLYYNGHWPEALLQQYAAPDIEFVDWPFAYWNDTLREERNGAQVLAQSDFLWHARTFADWALFIDLDEFVYFPVPPPLKDVVCLVLRMRWAVQGNRAKVVDVADLSPSEPWLLSDERMERTKHSKMLLRPRAFISVYVHYEEPHSVPQRQPREDCVEEHAPPQGRIVVLDERDGLLCHIANCALKMRSQWFRAPERTVRLVDSAPFGVS